MNTKFVSLALSTALLASVAAPALATGSEPTLPSQVKSGVPTTVGQNENKSSVNSAARKAYRLALLNNRKAYLAALKTARTTFEAAMKKAISDKSNDEKKAARVAFHDAVKAAQKALHVADAAARATLEAAEKVKA